MKPRISVVMPVRNGEIHLRQAVDSILQQTFTDFELIIVDDGSTDSTSEILRSYDDQRIRVIQEGRLGFVAAVNRGVELACAEWIARHDADDISASERLTKQWYAVQRSPATVLAYPGTEIFGELTKGSSGEHMPRTQALVALKSCFHNPICIGASLIKRSAFLAAKGYVEAEFPAEDYAFSSRLISTGTFVAVPGVQYRIRRHSQQISQVKLHAQLAQTKKIAIGNCQNFMRLDALNAERAYVALKSAAVDTSINDWLWVVFKCLPRLRWQSPELWAWVASQTIRRLAG